MMKIKKVISLFGQSYGVNLSPVVSHRAKRIDNMAFMDCKSLKKVTVPESVTTLYHGTFMNCYALSDVNYEDKNINMKDSSFKNTPAETALQLNNN